jgi:hypothetical protein
LKNLARSQCNKARARIVGTDDKVVSFCAMGPKPVLDLIKQAERELAETSVLVDEQVGIVRRLKRLGADTKAAILLLMDLLELRETREQRLAQLRFKLIRPR